jgi:hypothetical protein
MNKNTPALSLTHFKIIRYHINCQKWDEDEDENIYKPNKVVKMPD